MTVPTSLITRFAPSPNGLLHLGHAYAAVIAHDLARKAGGLFHLRIEDIDGTRSRSDLIPAALADLEWLGLGWDGPVIRQSGNSIRYHAAAARLRRMGLLYPCSCTRTEILAAAKTAGPEGPLYPGTCRNRAIPEPETYTNTAWRIDMAKAVTLAGPLHWHDARFGQQRARPEQFGDVVLVRKDAPASYHLAVTLDDAEQGVTLVSRGTDLFAATHVHRLLQALLHLSTPLYHHHALVIEADGRKLAKRRNSRSLSDLRQSGADGKALAEALRRQSLPAGLSFSTGLDWKT